MRRLILLVCLLVAPRVVAAQAASADSSEIAVHAATVLDGRGNALHDATVLVRNGRIVSVSSGPARRGRVTYELGDATLLPGIIDAHVHPGFFSDKVR